MRVHAQCHVVSERAETPVIRASSLMRHPVVGAGRCGRPVWPELSYNPGGCYPDVRTSVYGRVVARFIHDERE